jgi:hypothetical protein
MWHIWESEEFACTQWCSWLRHCATSQKVAGSIPEGAIGNFQEYFLGVKVAGV